MPPPTEAMPPPTEAMPVAMKEEAAIRLVLVVIHL
jgi:hypothetical protein